MRLRAVGAVIAATVLLGCHTITEELPTKPSKTPTSGVMTVPIPPIPLGNATPTPAPQPSATPAPSPDATPTPAPTPEPTPDPPDASGCGNPVPPEITRMNAKVHLRGPARDTLDSTPIVGPDGEYGATIGCTDGRSFCPVRPEGAPDRQACETLRVGLAEDTGRPGPTWTRNGKYCDGTACENHPDNQYLLWAYEGGTYEACARNGVCATVQVDR
jgi:hypothetical protein